MGIRSPGARLLRDVPLSFVKSSGQGRKRVDAPIALIPFVDFLLTVVVFLLMTFSVSGESCTLPDLPVAVNGADLELAPIVTIDDDVVTLDGRAVGDTRQLAVGAELERIEPLVAQLEVLRDNWDLLHPNDAFNGQVIIQAGRDVDYRVVRKVVFSLGQAGYGGLSLAVREG